MAQQDIIIGTANASGGDTYFDAFTKTQANFTENFTEISALQTTALTNRVIVKQASDFGVIDSTKEYFLDGIIDFTGTGLSIEVPAGGIFIRGYNFDISGIKCTDAGFTLFSSPAGGSGDVLFMDFLVDIQGAGSEVFDLTSDTGNEAVEVARINYNNCASLGTLTGYRQGLETGTGRFGGTPELTLAGAWLGGYFIEASIVRALTDGSYSLYKAGAAFVMQSRFRTNQNIDLNATVAFFDFAATSFPNPSTLQLDGCIVTRNGVADAADATLTPNITASNLSCSWSNNVGIGNTFEGGNLNITAETATVIAVAGAFVDLAGTYTSSDLQHFDEPANGQLRHLGTSPVNYKVGGQLVIDSSSNNEVDLKTVIFRAASTTFEDGKTVRRVINNLQGGRDVAYFAVSENVTLNQNDYVKLQVANVAATNNITAEIDSFFFVEER